MTQFGTCGHCHNEWYAVLPSGKLRMPKTIPTCPEGGIMAVCDQCFDALPSKTIIDIAVAAYSSGIEDASTPGIHMSQTEHLLVAAAITGWVRYMKGAATEPPFDEEALAI